MLCGRMQEKIGIHECQGTLSDEEQKGASYAYPEKIDRAKQEYTKKLSTFREAASAEDRGPTFEKDMIGILTDMIELKTEAEILKRVLDHQASHD